MAHMAGYLMSDARVMHRYKFYLSIPMPPDVNGNIMYASDEVVVEAASVRNGIDQVLKMGHPLQYIVNVEDLGTVHPITDTVGGPGRVPPIHDVYLNAEHNYQSPWRSPWGIYLVKYETDDNSGEEELELYEPFTEDDVLENLANAINDRYDTEVERQDIKILNIAQIGVGPTSRNAEPHHYMAVRGPFYHVTPSTNVSSIMRKGLVPSGGLGMDLEGRSKRGVYISPEREGLWDNVRMQIHEGTIWEDESRNWTMLEVTIPDDRRKLMGDEGYDYDRSMALRTSRSIPPEYIKVLDTRRMPATPDNYNHRSEYQQSPREWEATVQRQDQYGNPIVETINIIADTITDVIKALSDALGPIGTAFFLWRIKPLRRFM